MEVEDLRAENCKALPTETKETNGKTTLLFVDWKTEYHQDTNITQRDLPIQYTLCQNPSGFFFFCRNRKFHPNSYTGDLE